MLPHISDLEIPDEAGLFIDPSGQFDPFGLVPAVVESLHIVAECTVALLRQRFEGRAVSLPLGLGGAAASVKTGSLFEASHTAFTAVLSRNTGKVTVRFLSDRFSGSR